MKRYPFPILFILIGFSCSSVQEQNKTPYEGEIFYPAKELGELFQDVQMQRIFADGKTFVDYAPKYSINEITEDYKKGIDDLETFVENNFQRFPEIDLPDLDTDDLTLEEHLPNHWTYLTREADTSSISGSLLPLIRPYVVPGGRFREVYYWDSYFTLLGLAESGRIDLVKDMVDNFAYLIDTYGHIPNGNRSYYLSRSQPPFFSSMVMLLGEINGIESVLKYRPQLEKEYQFWMKGSQDLTQDEPTNQRVVLFNNGAILNRYWDNVPEPRPESYKEDFELAECLPKADKETMYRHLKAGAESGWDFSSRWFADGANISTIRTTDIVPVDLNCLLYHLEHSIGRIYEAKRNRSLAMEFYQKAENRRVEINRFLWNEEVDYYGDYLFVEGKKSGQLTAAVAAPLFFKVAEQAQADQVAQVIKDQLLLAGGLATTLSETGQQWDYPNGWAPLQWIAIKGLLNYGHDDLAREIAKRWLDLNRKVFVETGKMMEKYNVADLNVEAGGGEYPLQDGFGWTNGVALKIMAEFEGL